MKNILVLLCLMCLALAGCAPRQSLPVPEGEAAARWQAFRQQSRQNPAYDTISGSLRFGPENNTRRVTYTLWSGVAGDAGRAIRLEIYAGTGANVAKALFDKGRMLLLLPQEQKAYEGRENEENFRRIMGLTLPMSMDELYDFLAGGALPALADAEPETYRQGEDDNIAYALVLGGRRCELELNAHALPVRWSIPGHGTLTASYDNAGRPEKLEGSMVTSEGAQILVLLVKDRRHVSRQSASSLDLKVPPGISLYDLDR